MRKWTGLAAVIAVMAYGVTILVSTAGVQRQEFLTQVDSGLLRFGDETHEASIVRGIPPAPALGQPYAARILLPAADEGSRLDFSLVGADEQHAEADVYLCPKHVSVIDVSTCTIKVWESGVVYSSESNVELPAFVVFPSSLGEAVVRLRYTVTDPDVAWNPLDTPEERSFELGEFAVTAAG